jgi:hypothetical protein
VEGVAIGQRDRVKEAEDNLRSAAHNWRRALRFDAAKRAEQRAQEVALKCQHTIRKDGPRKVRERQRLVLGSTTIPRHTVPSRLQANHLSGLSAWRAVGAFTIVIGGPTVGEYRWRDHFRDCRRISVCPNGIQLF